ncbi:MAG TPA: glycosyltransferase family 4 protein [Actinomycetes bacterium]|nr:glycosyltransferase family 4 protein [Actinomycetes bacterium]
MRILVYPHELSVGGSQLNAVELAAAVRDLGHEVAVFGVPGTLAERVEELGLELVPAPDARRRPSPEVLRRLVETVKARKVDLVHGYEWPPALEAWYGPQVMAGVPTVATVLSMGVAPFLPRSMPLLVGTEQLQRSAARRFTRVGLIEPPVDTHANHPDVPADELRKQYELDPFCFTVVIVSRLAADLKLEGIERTILAVGQLAGQLPVRLLVVGDGPAREQVAALAAEVNAERGPDTVVLTGELLDPRPAYAVADVVLGMGGSVLRALAFAKPAIVLGEDGFSEILEPDSVGQFLWHGFYGLGDGNLGTERLEDQLCTLLTSPTLRKQLGRFSRQLVCGRYSLTGAAETLEEVYETVLRGPVPRLGALAEAPFTGAQLARYKLTRRRARRQGQVPTDDFNARPVLEPMPPGQPVGE